MNTTMKKRIRPIRVFRSPLTDNWYASRAWKQEPNGMVTITGEKFDVTAEVEFFISKAGYMPSAEAEALRERVRVLETALRKVEGIEQQIRLVAYASAGGPSLRDTMKTCALWAGSLQEAVAESAVSS